VGKAVVAKAALVEERGDEDKPGFRPVTHGHGHRPVQMDYRRGLEPQEGVIEAGNLRPIRFLRAARFGVNGGNGSLQGVGTETARMQRLPDEIAALGNGGAVPEAAKGIRSPSGVILAGRRES
jgi:hypothetical protein